MFWNHRFFFRIDFRILPIVWMLMMISIYVISAMSTDPAVSFSEAFFSPLVKSQIKWFILGSFFFLFFIGLDYHRLREWALFFYLLIILLLVGLYLTTPIQNVQRWYRLPWISMTLQPSEAAKLVVVLTLAWFLEKREQGVFSKATFLQAVVIVAVPFFLILKQPDLGTALVLYPITLVMFYFGGVRSGFVKMIGIVGLGALIFVALLFLGFLSHDKMRPFFTSFLKEYQYERLNPNTYHQNAATTAIAIGGMTGKGWHKSEFSSRKWLPAPHTDSVFAAFGEETGFIGMTFLLLLYCLLIYCCFEVVISAKDLFGRLLAAGITMYLAIHILMNIGMMCAFLPISGVPLVFITYGGNSVLTTMAALGILQSIYARRFMF